MTNFEKYKSEILSAIEHPDYRMEIKNDKVVLCAEKRSGVDDRFARFIKWAAEETGETETCEFCKYDDDGKSEYPCIQCKERYPNQFEPKPKEPELKPCPFCGKEARMVQNGYEHHHVQCVGCACHTMSYETSEEAIRTWNRREK